jgi:hypothetical protein
MDSVPVAPETTTIRTYTLSDGCTSTNCPQTIIVHETNAPSINCPASFVSPGPFITYTLPSATDDCGAVVTGNPPSGTPAAPDVYTVVITATNNAGLSDSCSFQVVVTNGALTDTYVDAAYSSYPPGTGVTWPASGGTGSHYIGYDAFASVQGGINSVASTGNVHVAAGTYTESVSAVKSVALLGANVGVAGCAARGPESIINGGSGAAVSVGSIGVTVDGFRLEGATGVSDLGFAALTAQNNVMAVTADGLTLINISGGFVVVNNCITLSSQLASSNPTAGLALFGVSGAPAPLIQGNNVSGAYFGYELYSLKAAGGAPTVISGGAVSGAVQAVSVFNIDLLNPTVYDSSVFTVDGLTASGFAGTANPQAGVYVYTGGSNLNAVVMGTITNVTITGVTKVSSDSAGIDLADFSTGVGVRQQIAILNSVISSNANRGIYVSKSNAVANISGCTLIGNGFDPVGTGGNPGFGIIAPHPRGSDCFQLFYCKPSYGHRALDCVRHWSQC